MCIRDRVLLVSPVRRMTERPLAQLIALLTQLGADLVQPASQEPVNALYPLVRIRPMSLQQEGLPTLTPVSYTHLDVYKRQLAPCGYSRMCVRYHRWHSN